MQDLQIYNRETPAKTGFSSTLADDFRAYLAGAVTETTADGYFVCIRNFLSFLQENGITQPQREDIIAYRDYLAQPHESERKGQAITFSATTQARYLRAVKAFFRWLDSRGVYKYPCSDIRGAKVQTGTFYRDSFAADETQALVASLQGDTEEALRNRAMMLLTINAGLRIIELHRANIGDIELKGKQAWIRVQGKGHSGKDLAKKIESRVYVSIMEYLEKRGTREAAAPLFAGCGRRAKGERLTEPAISAILKKLIVSAGFDSSRLTAHSLRHTFVTLDIKTGADIQEACADVGHSSIAVTQRYAHNIKAEESTAAARVAAVMFADKGTGAGLNTPAAALFGSLTLQEQNYYAELIRQNKRFTARENAI